MERTPGLKNRSSFSLENILSPDIAKQLYEITEGVKKREEKQHGIEKFNGIKNDNTSPKNNEYNEKEEFVINKLEFFAETSKKSDVAVDLKLKIDSILSNTETDLSNEAVSQKFLNRSEEIVNPKSSIELDMIFDEYDCFLEYDKDVLKFGDVVQVLNCFSRKLLIETNYNIKSKKPCFVIIKAKTTKSILLQRNIVKENDEFYIFDKENSKYVSVNEDREVVFSLDAFTWKISSSSFLSNKTAQEYEDRKQILSKQDFSSKYASQTNIFCSIRSSDFVYLECMNSKRLLHFNGTDKVILNQKSFDLSKDINLRRKHMWCFLKPSFVMNSQFLVDADLLPPIVDIKFEVDSYKFEKLQGFIVDEIIVALLGIEGTLFCKLVSVIRIKDVIYQDVSFKFRETYNHIEPSLTALSLKILELPKLYFLCKGFVEKFNNAGYGHIMTTFVEVVDDELIKYQKFVQSIENIFGDSNEKSLLNLYSKLQPYLTRLRLLKNLCIDCWCKHGTDILKVCEEYSKNNQFDVDKFELVNNIKTKCESRYLTFVKDWVTLGAFIDEFEEFFIEENKAVHKIDLVQDFNATYWDEKYVLSEKHYIPNFLKEHAQKILQAGKYINVVNESTVLPDSKTKNNVYKVLEDRNRVHCLVENSHKSASLALVKLLFKHDKLVSSFRTILNYFLLFNGDLFSEFLQVAEKELKMSSKLNTQKLEITLQNLLERCVFQFDKTDFGGFMLNKTNKIPFIVKLQTMSLAQQISLIHGKTRRDLDDIPVYLSISLSAFAEWPTSLVITKQLMTKYEFLFRLIFLLKYVEHILKSRIISQSKTSIRCHESILRSQKMNHFVSNMLYYVLFEVIEVKFDCFLKECSKIEAVEEIVTLSTNLVDSLLRECLLSHEQLLQKMFICLSSIVKGAETFDVHFKHFFENLSKEACSSQYFFLSNLCNRLDYNNYFDSSEDLY